MIYQLTAPALPVADYNIFRYLPPQGWGEGLWLATAAVLLLLILRIAMGKSPPRWVALVIPSLLFIGAFIYNYQLLDEVAVNLKHPYNLWHHGRFSMQPNAMVDGTVEWIFYLQHLPFAFSQTGLVMGNFFIALVIGWLHIFVLWRYRIFEGKQYGLLPLSLIASSFGLIGLLSNGFGNGLMSLVFLLAFIAQIKNRPILALFIGALLPFLRPEGIIWAGVNGLAVLFSTPDRAQLFRRRRFYLAALSPFIAMGFYFSFYKIFYGHWIPTPVLFKSTALSKLSDLNFNLLEFGLNAIALNYSLIKAMFVAMLVIVIIPLLARGFEKKKEESPLERLMQSFSRKVFEWLFRGQMREFAVFAAYFVATLTVMVCWFLTNFTYTNPIDRYYLIFFLMLVLFTVKLLTVALSDIAFTHAAEFYAGPRVAERSHPLRFVAWSGAILFLALTIPQKAAFDARNGWLYNRENMAMAGAVTQKLIPKNWLLAASEMNTFGFMTDHPLIDLWGYSNRTIASSNTCAEKNIKADKDIFQKTGPDLYFYHWLTEFPGDYHYGNLEDSFMHSEHSHANNKFARLGNLKHIFEDYDAVILRMGPKQVAYLTRRPLTKDFLANLEGQGFYLQKSRKVNSKLFDDEKLRRYHPC